MAGRWLPELKSFGAYFPSSTRKAEAAKNIKLKISSTKVESKEYVEDALLFYLEKAKAAFPEKSVHPLKRLLNSCMVSWQQNPSNW